jgi:putative ABC transport system ATP-binding protein
MSIATTHLDRHALERSPVLELERVTKTYPGVPAVQALRSVSLTIERGELVAVVGPSGSGKSTLFHLMGTLDQPTSGVVRVAGLDVSRLPDRQLAGMRGTTIGFVFQQFFLSEHASALENVADGLLYAGVPARERRRQAQAMLTAVGLGDRARARPTQLSGGERQRVAIARAMVGEPLIMLADEPTGNLDSHSSTEVLDLLRSLSDEDGAAVVLVTHDQAAAGYGSRELHLVDGRACAVDAAAPAVER